ncbi:hypothetical protein P0082_08390 [Candidatus Haliotispira prima]|uniref:Uncharacterized protein n=1 Tax=Candidatus Haliotispira prima TaxID=3034016 RepID=A0ABY8MEU0_9SPIO|nr:hypothetical protein P0082_08390 [Candidatus Haliotispira prima]
MVLSGCAPLTDSRDPSDDSPPAPKNTFTISFTGIQAVELTANLMEDMAVSAIVRLADEPAPVWADIKDKVSLLSRNIVAGTPKRIFTAKHYGTNDELKTNIGAMSAADFLQPETAYKVYIFQGESVIETLPFTTAAIPPADDFPSTKTGYSLNFAPNVLPFNAEITYIDNKSERKGLYELYSKEGEVLLMPFYMNSIRPLKIGWRLVNALGRTVAPCQFTSCLPDPGYASIPELIYQSIAANTYHKVLLGVQSFNKPVERDEGIGHIRDGSDGAPYFIRFIADQ